MENPLPEVEEFPAAAETPPAACEPPVEPSPAPEPAPAGRAREYVGLLLEVLLFVFFINAFLVQSFVIPSPSMEKNLLIGDHLLVDNLAYSQSLGRVDGILLPQMSIQRYMMVTFKAPPEIPRQKLERILYVKRVVAMPGETIHIVNNRVFINGAPLAEPYTFFHDTPSIRNFPPEDAFDWYSEFPREFRECVEETAQGRVFRVPAGHYFCMGDNRDNSFDSRYWGPVPRDSIVGRPWRIFWSIESSRDRYQDGGFLTRLKNLGATLLSAFTDTRWSRTLKKCE